MYSASFCALVIDLGRLGRSRVQIAATLDICFHTLASFESKHPEFLQSMLRARELSQAWWEDQGQTGIWNREFNANAYRLQVTNRFPEAWRDKQQVEHTGKDGAEIEPASLTIGQIHQHLISLGCKPHEFGQPIPIHHRLA